jgi:hypothetical protein
MTVALADPPAPLPHRLHDRGLDALLAAGRSVKSGQVHAELRYEIEGPDGTETGSQRCDIWFQRPNRLVVLAQGVPVGQASDGPRQMLVASDGRQLVRHLVDGCSKKPSSEPAGPDIASLVDANQSCDCIVGLLPLDPTERFSEEFLLDMQPTPSPHGFEARWSDRETGAEKTLAVDLDPDTHLLETYDVRMKGDKERMHIHIDFTWSSLGRDFGEGFFRNWVEGAL